MTEPAGSAQAPGVAATPPGTGGEFRALFEREFAYVCRSLRRMGVQAGDVEDLAQEVFMALYAKFSSYDPARPLRPWIFGFVARSAANYRRLARHRRERSDRGAEPASAAPTPESAMAERESGELLLRALEAVELDRRTALIMHDIDGFSAAEISDALAIPINTVYSRVRVAREELGKAIHRLRLRRGEGEVRDGR
jgi:RNA polymerase sigma-70 factor, ECF subfamily